MRTAWTRYRADLLCLAGLLILALAFFWPVTLGLGFIPRGGGDLASFLYPIYAFAQRVLHSGHLPLWNPHLYLGAPHVRFADWPALQQAWAERGQVQG